MKVILFLGAGVSEPSGLPLVEKLTDWVLTHPYHQDAERHFSFGPQLDPKRRRTDATPRIRQLLRLFKEHDERDIARVGYYPTGSGYRSSGAIYRSATTYEDLFFLCAQIRLWNRGLSDNSLTTPFMERIAQNAGTLLRGRDIVDRMCDLATLADLSCAFIESVVAGSLNAKKIVGFGLLRELAIAADIEQLNIVTLNHDTLVEQFLLANSVPYTDGFGKADGDVRWYNDAMFDKAPARVRLLKLHGSLNWYPFEKKGRIQTAICLRTDVENANSGDGKRLASASRRPSFLSGLEKPVMYQSGIYADIHFRYHKALRQCNLMLMSGYGWGDIGINFQLDNWLDQEQRRTIILLHRNPEALTKASLIMASGYDHWTQSKKLIPIRKWLSEVTPRQVRSVMRRHLASS